MLVAEARNSRNWVLLLERLIFVDGSRCRSHGTLFGSSFGTPVCGHVKKSRSNIPKSCSCSFNPWRRSLTYGLFMPLGSATRDMPPHGLARIYMVFSQHLCLAVVKGWHQIITRYITVTRSLSCGLLRPASRSPHTGGEPTQDTRKMRLLAAATQAASLLIILRRWLDE